MTQDEAEKLAAILIARQVPEANAAGFGWQWSVDIETGRVQLDKGETLTPDLFLAVTTPSQHLSADGPSFAAVNPTYKVVQITADRVEEMAELWRKQHAASDYHAERVAELEAAMKAQTIKFRTQWIAGRTPADDDGA